MIKTAYVQYTTWEAEVANHDQDPGYLKKNKKSGYFLLFKTSCMITIRASSDLFLMKQLHDYADVDEANQLEGLVHQNQSRYHLRNPKDGNAFPSRLASSKLLPHYHDHSRRDLLLLLLPATSSSKKSSWPLKELCCWYGLCTTLRSETFSRSVGRFFRPSVSLISCSFQNPITSTLWWEVRKISRLGWRKRWSQPLKKTEDYAWGCSVNKSWPSSPFR